MRDRPGQRPGRATHVELWTCDGPKQGGDLEWASTTVARPKSHRPWVPMLPNV